MSDDLIKQHMMDYVNGVMDDQQRKDFERTIQNNTQLNKELQVLLEMQQLLTNQPHEAIEAASTAMDEKFYAMLKKESQHKTQTRSLGSWLSQLFNMKSLKPAFQGGVLMLLGFFIGTRFVEPQSQLIVLPSAQTASTQLSEHQINALNVLSMLERPSPSTRLQAIHIAQEDEVSDVVLIALLNTLNTDENVNVRLEAVDALAQYASLPLVRQGLIQSIVKQDSPLVQMQLANLMLGLKEKQAIKPFQELLEQDQLIDSVREKITNTLDELI